MKRVFFILLSMMWVCCGASFADDGSMLWLHRTSNSNAQIKLQAKNTPTLDIAVQELTDGWTGGPVNLKLAKRKGMKRDGFMISRKKGVVTITSPSDIGLLYGAYRLLQMQTMGTAAQDFETMDNP